MPLTDAALAEIERRGYVGIEGETIVVLVAEVRALRALIREIADAPRVPYSGEFGHDRLHLVDGNAVNRARALLDGAGAEVAG